MKKYLILLSFIVSCGMGFAQDIVPVKDSKKNLYGYKESGHFEWVIKPAFKEASVFNNRLAVVATDSAYYAINSKGERVSKDFDLLSNLSNVGVNAYCARYKDGGYQILNAKFGPIINEVYESLYAFKAFGSYVFKVKKGGLYGCIDALGNVLVPAEYKYIVFSQDYYYACGYKKCTKDGITHGMFLDAFIEVCDKNGKWGVLTLSNEVIVPCNYATQNKLYKAIKGLYKKTFRPFFLTGKYQQYKEKLTAMVAAANDKVNKDNLLIAETYPTDIPTVNKVYAKKLKKGYAFYAGKKQKGALYKDILKMDKFFIVQQKGKYGVCDLSGEAILPCEYDNVDVWNAGEGDDILLVEKAGKFGLLSVDGSERTPIKYDIISLPTKGLATATEGGAVWLVDKNGYIVSKRGYSAIDISPVSGTATARIADYSTTITSLGTEVIPFSKQVFDEAYALPDNGNEQKKFDLYMLCAQLDKDGKDGYKASAINNIGSIFEALGDTDKALEYYEQARDLGSEQARKNVRSIKTDRVLNTLQQIGESLQQVAQTIDTSGKYSTLQTGGTDASAYGSLGIGESAGGSSGSGKLSEDYYKNMYAKWERNAKRAYDELTGEKWKPSGYTAMKRNLRTAQREMRDLRSKARRDGYTIPQSTYETVTVSQ